MIYFDGIHLVTDNTDLAELHEFAQRLGIKRCWFEGVRKKHPHYDVPKKYIDIVKDQPDVKLVDSREIVEVNQLRNLTISTIKYLDSKEGERDLLEAHRLVEERINELDRPFTLDLTRRITI